MQLNTRRFSTARCRRLPSQLPRRTRSGLRYASITDWDLGIGFTSDGTLRSTWGSSSGRFSMGALEVLRSYLGMDSLLSGLSTRSGNGPMSRPAVVRPHERPRRLLPASQGAAIAAFHRRRPSNADRRLSTYNGFQNQSEYCTPHAPRCLQVRCPQQRSVLAPSPYPTDVYAADDLSANRSPHRLRPAVFPVDNRLQPATASAIVGGTSP